MQILLTRPSRRKSQSSRRRESNLQGMLNKNASFHCREMQWALCNVRKKEGVLSSDKHEKYNSCANMP